MHKYVVPENIKFNSKNPFVLLMAAFVSKISIFTESNNMGVVLEIFYFCFQVL